MPTGPQHYKHTEIAGGSGQSWGESCRCTIGEDHMVGDEFPLSSAMGASEAEDIWLGSGQDEDYDFR